MADDLLLNIDPLQRPGQAAQLIALGDLPGAWDAMLRPQELTPAERDALLKKWKVAGTPMEAVYRMVTNPLLLSSLALSYVFPVASAKNMLKVSKSVGGMMGRLPLLRGLSSYQGIFQGTKIPDTIDTVIAAKQTFSTKYLTQLGKIFEESGLELDSRGEKMLGAWLAGLHRPLAGFKGEVGALLPNLEREMGPQLVGVANQVKGALQDIRKEVFGGIKGKQLQRALARHRGSGYFDDIDEMVMDLASEGAPLFPRRAVQTEEGFRTFMGALLKGEAKDPATQRKVLRWLGKRQEAKAYSMVPSLQEVQELGDLVDPVEYGKMANILKRQVINGARGKVRPQILDRLADMPVEEVLGNYQQYMQGPEALNFARSVSDHLPHHYSLKAGPVLEQYIHNVGTTYAYHTTGAGDKLETAVRKMTRLGATDSRAAWRAEVLKNTYIPSLLGRQTPRQTIRAQAWDQSMKRLSLMLDNPTAKTVLGDNVTSWLKGSLQQSRGSLSLLEIDRKLSGYFYLSTLGMNPGSAIKNLGDYMKVAAVVGPKAAWKGMERAIVKGEQYFTARLTQGLSHEEALAKAFPDFVEAGIAGAPITSEALENAFKNATNIAAIPTGKVVKTGEKVSRAMMSLFSGSEYANRLAGFEAGLIHASNSGLAGREAREFARQIVTRTQFAGGPLSGPAALIGRSPTLTQFLRFPTQILDFVTNTAVTLGSAEKNWLGYNPGTLARTVAGAVMAYELGDSLGVNMGDALIGGALPTFQEAGKPFAPLPVVPPAIQLAGSVALGVASGDFAEAVRSTPLLVPGGVQIYRAMGILPPGLPGASVGQDAARWMDRTYADYKQPAPDGRIAVFSGKDTLKGYFTPWELLASGLGIKAGGPSREQEVLELLIKNRDQIRDYRKQAIEALFQNDPRSFGSIQREFKTRYGFDMPLSGDDVKAAQARRRMTRIEQVYQTLPPAARGHFLPVLQAAFGREAQAVLGIDPELLNSPPAQRAVSRPGGVHQPGSPYTNQLGPLDNLNAGAVSRSPLPTLGLP